MRSHYLAVVIAAATLTQAGCAIGSRGETGRAPSPPVMVVPSDPVSGQLEPAAPPDVPPRIQPVPSR
jgi:hypothetical protein